MPVGQADVRNYRALAAKKYHGTDSNIRAGIKKPPRRTVFSIILFKFALAEVAGMAEFLPLLPFLPCRFF